MNALNQLRPSMPMGGAASDRSAALWQELRSAYRSSEEQAAATALARAALPVEARQHIRDYALKLVHAARARGLPALGIEAFLAEYQLTSLEGVALMCLAEALLRTPDDETIDRLIADKLTAADWSSHTGRSSSLFVNASSWALMLTRSALEPRSASEAGLTAVLRAMVRRLGGPVIRAAALQAIRLMGGQFVMGETIEEALSAAARDEKAGWRHSFDMLGESARTAADAERYWQSYATAIDAIGVMARGRAVEDAPGISIKLTALHPRFEVAQAGRAIPELLQATQSLVERARAAGVGVTIDAEEAARLEPSLELFAAMAAAPELAGWNGLGLAVQAYQKRAVPVIDWLADLGGRTGRRLMVRLVKGAYWDTEIKRAQEAGVSNYPVFTRKGNTDVSYLACAKALIANPAVFYPQFATHNAQTLAAVAHLGQAGGRYEFQRLHGMGEGLYLAHREVDPGRRCRIYAPVGAHRDLLPYLVRRLLENGANSSFVNQLHDASIDIDALVADPIDRLEQLSMKQNPRIPLPRALFGSQRRNSDGRDLTDSDVLARLSRAAQGAFIPPASVAPQLAGRPERSGRLRRIVSPQDPARLLGEAWDLPEEDAAAVVAAAHAAFAQWSGTPAATRAAALDTAADLFEAELDAFAGMICAEGGRTLADAVAEVRETIDFCRYYAAEARRLFAEPMALPGPAGEINQLVLAGRGVFICISPWNFPMAIFAGQVAAALVAGNCVVAKPAEETPLVAARVVNVLHRAGVPAAALILAPGDGATGAALVNAPLTAGVAFTGSTGAAKAIQRALAMRDGPILPLIAETGGMNAMIVDSTALLEQVLGDVLLSAFNSAGQRCSALRVLYIQDDVADRFAELLKGAMAELVIGDPASPATDVGPVISPAAAAVLAEHVDWLGSHGVPVAAAAVPAGLPRAYVAPQVHAIAGIDLLSGEVFGPILHIVRWQAGTLDAVLDAINATGYGLTLGVHSRIDATIAHVRARAKAGNIYINRNMVGAVVGCQPFGGEGLSGTGPKAGGPHYLMRFATERTVSHDTTAIGGNASLLCASGEGEA